MSVFSTLKLCRKAKYLTRTGFCMSYRIGNGVQLSHLHRTIATPPFEVIVIEAAYCNHRRWKIGLDLACVPHFLLQLEWMIKRLGQNVAIEEETVPWIETIREQNSWDEMIIRTYRSRESFNDTWAFELARTFSGELIHYLDLDVSHGFRIWWLIAVISGRSSWLDRHRWSL